jgi:putative addiction module component (TIGR02574 family)
MVAKPSRADVLHDALELSAEDRAELAAELLASLDGPPDADASEAWTGEIRRRVGRALDGELRATPWSEAHERLKSRWGA